MVINLLIYPPSKNNNDCGVATSNQLDVNKDYGFTIRTNLIQELPRWDKFRYEKIKIISEKCSNVIDFGGAARSCKELFFFKNYQTVDFCEKFKPDIAADICNLKSIETESIDGIICSAVLEHVYNPFKAVEELYRVLKKEGLMYVYVPFIWKYHAPQTGEFKDYWRFSKDGIKYLFLEYGKFSKMEYEPIRYHKETILNLTKRFGKKSFFHNVIGKRIFSNEPYNDEMTSGFNIFLSK